ncbi:MAG: molybdopterin molybdotransferase MoeA, partial [Opitutaceae bacterium]|nr:molybdopterin molybdotransferase MoeA [Opitutaceae bacterium]
AMLTPAAALDLILQNQATFSAEPCALARAHGRVLRRDICADRDQPPFHRVALDGYALRSAAVAQGIRRFRVVAVQAAGMRPAELGEEPDACVEIMTGAVLPAGADCVVPYEETTRETITAHQESVTYYVTLSDSAIQGSQAGRAVHARGSDFAAGDLVVAKGCRLGAREIAVAASCGCAEPSVSRWPKIAVISTGDELVEVDAVVAPHQVRRSNDYALRAALIAAGYPVVERFHLHDMKHEMEHQMWHIMAEFDVALLTGGVSKGKFDYLPAVLESLGVKKIFHGVAQRPGKPFWFGLGSRQNSVFALPGNPVSAYTCLHRYALPALAHASRHQPMSPRKIRLAEAFTFCAPLACMLPVKLVVDAAGNQTASPRPTNSSGDFAGLVGTDGFVELPAEQNEFPAGTIANFWPWA